MNSSQSAADEAAQQADQTEQAQYLTFGLGGEMFAVNVDRVREVLDLQHIARLANAPSVLLGITDVRGAGIPVIDLKSKLGLPMGEMSEQSRIIVLQVEAAEGSVVLGALTDAVYEVTQLGADSLAPPPRTGIDWDQSYMLGIGRRDGRFVTLLDLSKVFAADRFEFGGHA